MNMDTGELRHMTASDAKGSDGRWMMLSNEELLEAEKMYQKDRVEHMVSFIRQFNPKKAKRLGL